MRLRSAVGCVCVLLLLVLPGCAPSGVPEGPAPVAVDGTVTLDGQPLAGASLMFGQSAFGETDANGHYELAAAGGKKGCPPGEYKVVIEKWVMPDGSPYKSGDMSPMDAGAKQELPAKYTDPEATELKATVPAEGGTFPFELKSDGK